MATLEEFKALRAGVAPEVQTELYGLMSSDPEAGKQRMVEIAAGQGVTLTTEEVRGFLQQMNEERRIRRHRAGCGCPDCHCWRTNWAYKRLLNDDNPQRLQSSSRLSPC